MIGSGDYRVRETPYPVAGIDPVCRHLTHSRAKAHAATMNAMRLAPSYRYEAHQTVSPPWWWPWPTWQCVAMQNVLVEVPS